MEAVAVVVVREAVGLSVQGKLRAADAVPDTAYRRAKEAVAGFILRRGVVAEDHVGQFPGAVRNFEGLDRRAIVDQGHGSPDTVFNAVCSHVCAVLKLPERKTCYTHGYLLSALIDSVYPVYLLFFCTVCSGTQKYDIMEKTGREQSRRRRE